MRENEVRFSLPEKGSPFSASISANDSDYTAEDEVTITVVPEP
jgi:hypothetical protein